MNNPISNLTTTYLDTPPVGPTPDPLEHAHPQTSTIVFQHTCAEKGPSPRTCLLGNIYTPPILRHIYIPPLVRRNCAGGPTFFHEWKIEGNPL